MAKKIVICMDGTGNEIEENISNVLKTYRAAQKDDDQYVFYTQGVGTLLESKPWSKITRAIKDQLLGGAFGFGLETRIQSAYGFLVDHYEAGDEIFIFGYSREAYSARALAGMIHAVGVLRPHQKNLIGPAFMAYMSEPRAHKPIPKPVRTKPFKDAEIKADQDADDVTDTRAQSIRRITQSYDPAIKFLGLFDTVSSVFTPTYFSNTIWPFSRAAHPHSYYNPSVEIVRHAMGLDERRHMFQIDRWPADQFHYRNPYVPVTEQSLKEVWFCGWHGDVGGGNIRKDSGLSQFPLIWMLGEAMEAGLKTHTQTRNYVTGVKPYTAGTKHVYPPASVDAPLHPSLNFKPMGLFWWLTEFLIYPPNRTRPEAQNEKWPIWPRGKSYRKALRTDVVHPSVCERISDEYRPPSLRIEHCQTGESQTGDVSD